MANSKDKNKQNNQKTQDEHNEPTLTEACSAEDILLAATAQAEEYKNLAQRVQADFDNYRKRNNDSIRCARADGCNDVVINLLPVVDSVEIALKVIPDEKSREGVGLILKQFTNLFGKYGITEIPAEGEAFDPEYHDAVMQVDDEANAGKVVEVLQKGYIRDGKVIRHSMVKVAK